MLHAAGAAVQRLAREKRAAGMEERERMMGRLLKRSLLALALALASLSTPASPALARQGGAPPAGPVIVFVVGGDVGSTGSTLDALAIVEGGRFKAPYAEQEMDEAKKFAGQHMRAGQKYRLTFGGGDVGTVTVREAIEGCNNIHANAASETTAPIRGRIMGLATSSDALGRRAPSRRAPETAEREAVLQLVRDIYRKRRTPAAWLNALEVTNLTATDLDGDGRFEMVGSFIVETKRKQRRDLFLIAAPQAAGFRADFVKFQAYTLSPEGFTSRVDFVDQLDMDGDGLAEVVTVDSGFDAYSYSIYRKSAGRWRLVHSFIGDAC
jgi:hypothetical protein